MNFLFSVPRWWILHVPRGWQKTRGHCSGKISGTPGRPEQTNPFHQVRREPGGGVRCETRDGNICVAGSVWRVTAGTAPPPTCPSQSSFRTSMTTRPCFNLKVCIIAVPHHLWPSAGGLLLQRNSLDIHHSRTQSVKSEDKRNILCKLLRPAPTLPLSSHCQQNI